MMSAPVRVATAAPEWCASAVCPPEWAEAVAHCGGGFFHTPVGLRLSSPPGEMRFLELRDGDSLLGVSAVMLQRCRLSVRPRHAHVPTLPAVRDGVAPEQAVTLLRRALNDLGAAEVHVGSFDADRDLESRPVDEATHRMEYVVRLDGDPGGLVARFSENHRRRVRRGERDGWELRVLGGAAALDAIANVQDMAAERATRRGDGFDPSAPILDALSPSSLGDPWGAVTLGAYAGTTLLAAAVIGWANARAFYVLGGSTADGYARGAAVWLHWRAMRDFAAVGGRRYNLGGTPATATDPGDPSHGLYRFKTGFGAELHQRSSARWTLAAAHVRSHAVGRWVARRVRG